MLIEGQHHLNAKGDHFLSPNQLNLSLHNILVKAILYILVIVLVVLTPAFARTTSIGSFKAGPTIGRNVTKPTTPERTTPFTTTPAAPTTRKPPPKELTIGYITTLNITRKHGLPLPGRLISGALTYAIDVVNNDSNILPDTELKFELAESHGEENISLWQTSELIKKGVHAIIGPEGTCVHEAMLAGVYNIPMISYVSTIYTDVVSL
uniref:Receptor ligand binding region domain-containing protein n=1 Tax=Biomphalaria glabrata TaxID=6526 RepID=A0A2C9JYD7_BIOGL